MRRLFHQGVLVPLSWFLPRFPGSRSFGIPVLFSEALLTGVPVPGKRSSLGSGSAWILPKTSSHAYLTSGTGKWDCPLIDR